MHYNAFMLSREDLAFMYLEQLPFEPSFQEEAIFGWFSSEQGMLVCAPTGMGKTLIAEAGIYEVMKTGKKAYYTTPLIALTEQKYREIQAALERWGYSKHYVGLVTGNRRENPDVPILVVVAEILFNRLLFMQTASVTTFMKSRLTPRVLATESFHAIGLSDSNNRQSRKARSELINVSEQS